MRPSRALLMLVAGMAVLSSGCLDFQKQTIVAVFHPDKDEITALVVYEGFQVRGGNSDTLITSVAEDFDRLARGDEFGFGYSTAWFRFLPDLIGWLPEDEKIEVDWEAFGKQFTIHKGTFFLNQAGALCGTQIVSIREVSKVVEKANSLLNVAIAAKIKWERGKTIRTGSIDDETLKRWEDAVKNKHRWVRIDSGRITVTLPGSPRYFKHVSEGLRENSPFTAIPFKTDQRKDALVLSL